MNKHFDFLDAGGRAVIEHAEKDSIVKPSKHSWDSKLSRVEDAEAGEPTLSEG